MSNLGDKSRDLDTGAIREVCERHGQALARFLRARGVRPDDVDDLVQECMLTLWAKQGKGREGRGRAFLFGVARNLARIWRRNLGRQIQQVDRVRARCARRDREGVGSDRSSRSDTRGRRAPASPRAPCDNQRSPPARSDRAAPRGSAVRYPPARRSCSWCRGAARSSSTGPGPPPGSLLWSTHGC